MHTTNTTIIVPDEMGAQKLGTISGVKPVVVSPDKPIPADAQDATILVVGPAEQPHEVTAALEQMRQLPHLQLVQTLGQGTEQWTGRLPKDVTLTTARGAHGGSTAEWAVMALLAIVRDLPVFMTQQAKRQWNGHTTNTLLGARILIYGASDLGTNIRDRLTPFGAKITMVGGHAREDIIDTKMAQSRLPETDVVMLALPLTPATQSLVDASFLAALPDGAIIVNAARGGLVDQAALCKELHDQRLFAALDVTTPEPLPADDRLWQVPNLIVTPHVAGNTRGADERAWTVATEQISAFLRGDTPTNTAT